MSRIVTVIETRRFGTWICFRLYVRGGRYVLFGPLESAKLIQSSYVEFRTMDQIHETSDSECYIPSS
jgi:hypothetical protein